jgi:hypothetical protein
LWLLHALVLAFVAIEVLDFAYDAERPGVFAFSLVALLAEIALVFETMRSRKEAKHRLAEVEGAVTTVGRRVERVAGAINSIVVDLELNAWASDWVGARASGTRPLALRRDQRFVALQPVNRSDAARPAFAAPIALHLSGDLRWPAASNGVVAVQFLASAPDGRPPLGNQLSDLPLYDSIEICIPFYSHETASGELEVSVEARIKVNHKPVATARTTKPQRIGLAPSMWVTIPLRLDPPVSLNQLGNEPRQQSVLTRWRATEQN